MNKTVYVETIFHDFKMAGIGSVCTSKKKAINFLRQIKAEQFVKEYSEDDLYVVYRLNGITVQIAFQESYTL